MHDVRARCARRKENTVYGDCGEDAARAVVCDGVQHNGAVHRDRCAADVCAHALLRGGEGRQKSRQERGGRGGAVSTALE